MNHFLRDDTFLVKCKLFGEDNLIVEDIFPEVEITIRINTFSSGDTFIFRVNNFSGLTHFWGNLNLSGVIVSL